MMILLHLSTTGKPAFIDTKSILFVEECVEKDENNKEISFTRIYLKQPLIDSKSQTSCVDVQESVEKLFKNIK